MLNLKVNKQEVKLVRTQGNNQQSIKHINKLSKSK